jgi:hypothetical protein
VSGMPRFASVSRADRWLSSTSLMICNFSDAAYLIRGLPPPSNMLFFKQAEFQFLLGNDLLQVTGFAVKVLHLVSVCGTCRAASKAPLSCLHDVPRPFVVNALRDALTTALLSNASRATQVIQDDPDLLFRSILFAGRPFNVFDDLLAKRRHILSAWP